ncbi:toll-like receptor 2 [Argopecten irradians]|uniref:toll-like receptor 2 n=1 Tax=Argopecten irradians TaxID=31199 RepID=UPI00371FC376
MYMPNLLSLKMDSNDMRKISGGAFDGLANLQCLSLSDNRLDSSLGEDVFKPLVNLRVLSIYRNTFHIDKSYPNNALSYLSSIETLEVDIFQDFVFGSPFMHFRTLTTLYLNGIEICSIHNASFIGLGSSPITNLTIHSRIRYIEKNALSPFINLTELNINSRKTLDIRDVFQALYGLRNRTMGQLMFENNYIRAQPPVTLTATDIMFLKTICVKRLYLIRNSLMFIPFRTVTAWTNRNCIAILDLSVNKFSEFSQSFLTLPLFHELTNFSLTHNIPSRTKRSMVFKEASEKIFVLPPKLVFLNISRNYIRLHDNNTHFSSNNSLKSYDISYQRKNAFLLTIHGKDLSHLEELFVSGMSCTHVRCIEIAPMTKLSKLEARQCNLKNEFLLLNSTSVFRGLTNLTYLDLSANHLNQWSSLLFNDQRQSLNVLLISQNEIDVFPTEALNVLEQLEYLDISNNALTTLTLSDYELLEKLKQRSPKLLVNLHGNRLVCSCDDLEFLRWMLSTTVLMDKDNLRCVTSLGDSITIKHLQENFDKFEIDCASISWLIVSIVLLVVMYLFLTVSFVSWKYSAKLRIWCRQPLEGDFTHHAFISYADTDGSWVRKHIEPYLEQEEISFMCADKDFKPGKDIASNILDTIDLCYKSVFVVSYEFLNSEWPRYAMQVASGYSFRKGRETMNIVILLDDIQLSELPKLLRKNWVNVRRLRWPRDESTCQGEDGENISIETKRENVLKKLSKYIQNGIPELHPVGDTLQSETIV